MENVFKLPEWKAEEYLKSEESIKTFLAEAIHEGDTPEQIEHVKAIVKRAREMHGLPDDNSN